MSKERKGGNPGRRDYIVARERMYLVGVVTNMGGVVKSNMGGVVVSDMGGIVMTIMGGVVLSNLRGVIVSLSFGTW